MIRSEKSVMDYLDLLPAERKTIISQIHETILEHLPDGFVSMINYGMIGYVVPHNLYPSGYHCDPKQPLPFMGLASQKSHIGLYHMGIYVDEKLLAWFKENYTRVVPKYKLDMGKSCIRFKKPESVPLQLIGELATKMTVDQWISFYEKALKK